MNVGPVAIRAAQAPDLSGLQRVAQATWHATYAEALPQEAIDEFLRSNYSLERLQRILERDTAELLVAERDEEIVGYATIGVNQEDVAELFAIYVLPKHQQQGVGKQLWDRVRGRMQASHHQSFMLWVLDTNWQARRFYERQGATFIGARKLEIGGEQIHEVKYQYDLLRPS